MATDQELFAKLDAWLSQQTQPPTILDVLVARDVELLGAFILKKFRIVARDAVVERIERESKSMTGNPENNGAVVRLVDVLVQELGLTQSESVGLLGLEDSAELDSLRDKPSSAIPIQMLERLTILLDIHCALNVLLPAEGRPAAWLRTPNKASLFAGAAAIAVMEKGLDEMRSVRSYLRAQLYAP